RPLKPAEVKSWKQQPPRDSTAYPQRDALLFALRGLTGKDAGPTTAAWMELFPNANAEAEGLRLSTALLQAAPDQRDPLLSHYRDAKDDGHAEGLACAIPHLPGNLQAKVRDALAERLS